MPWANYWDKVKRYFEFSMTEWKEFAVLVIVFAFMLSFTQWGTEQFDAEEGVKNFLIALVLVSMSVFVHHAAQRLWGLRYGYRVEHRVWWAGLFAGILVLLLSNGRILLFAASAMHAYFLPIHRLGRMRYGPSLQQIGMTALVGPVAAVVFAFILYSIVPVPAFSRLLTFNLLFAAYQMIPFPPLDGLHVFVGARTAYGSSFVYVFTVSAFFGFFLMRFLAQLSIFWSFIIALAIGVIGWIIFYALVEK